LRRIDAASLLLEMSKGLFYLSRAEPANKNKNKKQNKTKQNRHLISVLANRIKIATFI